MWRDIKVRYKQTALGAAWAVIQPLMLMVVFTIFLGQLAASGPTGIPYPVFSFAALVPWTFFSSALAGAANSLVGSSQSRLEDLLPATPDPARGRLLVRARSRDQLCRAARSHGGVRRSLRQRTSYLVPVFALYVVARGYRRGLLLSALNVRYRDVRYAVPFLIQLWLFATPVAYQFSVVGSQYRLIFALNPMVDRHRRFPLGAARNRWDSGRASSRSRQLRRSCCSSAVTCISGGSSELSRT